MESGSRHSHRGPPGVRGRLRISAFGDRPAGAGGRRHVSVYVPGRGYDGLADTDLRGFLDGGYSHPWNQAGQNHVRVGRSGREHVQWPRFGEHEVFRALQRWDRIELPPHSRILGASLRLTVQEPCSWPVRILLYEVKRDWNAGRGGLRRDDLSPPREGECWWLETEHGRSAWAMPGASRAARDEAGADTDLMPLAVADYEPGDRSIRFESAELAACIARRLGERKPPAFLLKTPDSQEDVPGLRLAFHSAEYGDDWETGRRPRLTLEWESAAELAGVEHLVHLEHGRTWTAPPFTHPHARWVAVSFIPEPGYESPTLERAVAAAGGAATHGAADAAVQPGASNWAPVHGPFEADPNPIRLRVSALRNRLALGRPFVGGFRDNWVVTGPAEDQPVFWHFEAPSGRTHRVRARYVGGFRWETRFMPDEPGRWRFRWAHAFYEPGRVDWSATGRFDVVAEAIGPIRERLIALVPVVEAARRSKDEPELDSLAIRFHALQRAAVRLTGASARLDGSDGVLRDEINAVRSAFWAKPVPSTFPIAAMPVRRKVDGRALRDPIPRTRQLRASEDGGVRSRLEDGARRLARLAGLGGARQRLAAGRRMLARAARALPVPLMGRPGEDGEDGSESSGA